MNTFRDYAPCPSGGLTVAVSIPCRNRNRHDVETTQLPIAEKPALARGEIVNLSEACKLL